MSEGQYRRVRVAAENDVREGEGLAAKAGDTTVALFRVEGQCYAIANACPHKGGPLAEGDVEGHEVHCPWHGWTWDVRTGLNKRQPGTAVACFPVTVENGEVFIDIGEPASSI